MTIYDPTNGWTNYKSKEPYFALEEYWHFLDVHYVDVLSVYNEHLYVRFDNDFTFFDWI